MRGPDPTDRSRLRTRPQEGDGAPLSDRRPTPRKDPGPLPKADPARRAARGEGGEGRFGLVVPETIMAGARLACTRHETHLRLIGPAAAKTTQPLRTSCPDSYGVTELTEVPQFAKPSLVPPQVARAKALNAAPVQFGYWMYWVAK